MILGNIGNRQIVFILEIKWLPTAQHCAGSLNRKKTYKPGNGLIACNVSLQVKRQEHMVLLLPFR
jgi:hypothetical protein